MSNSGERPIVAYSNILDQKRYFFALKYVNNKNVLDCACGNGWGSFVMAMSGSKKVLGLDLSDEAINDANYFFSDKKITFKTIDIDNFITEEKFDLITCFETIEHVKDPTKLLKKFYSLSTENSQILLSTPNAQMFNEPNKKPLNPFHIREFTKKELEKIINDSGWQVKDYYGQYIIDEYSNEIDNYRRFIKRFWKDKGRSEKYGFLYTYIAKIWRRLINDLIKDPAHNTDCTPKKVNDGSMPAYHYFILCKRQ